MTEHAKTALFRNLNALGILAICTVLLVAFYSQLVDGELPCPLCLLQRVGCVAVLTGLVLNVVKGPKPDHYSIVIISAFFGAAVSLRQIALHIVPGSGSYGAPFLGYHYYTWSFVVFSLVILGTAIVAAYSTQYRGQRFLAFRDLNGLCKFAIALALAVVGANVVTTFAECGPWQCPGDPVSYWLFS